MSELADGKEWSKATIFDGVIELVKDGDPVMHFPDGVRVFGLDGTSHCYVPEVAFRLMFD